MGIHDERFTRRGFLAGAGALVASSLIETGLAADEKRLLGQWMDDDLGLPCYHYTGPLRFPGSPKQNDTTMLPDDPVFLLGNYRLTLFTHASGLYQVITGERAWGRMNQGDERWSGSNRASVTLQGETHELIGLHEPMAERAEKHFGVGFARYQYRVGQTLEVTRRLSVAPSTKPGEGLSAFLVQVRLRNTSAEPVEVRYAESTRARYQQLFAVWSGDQNEVTYTPQPGRELQGNVLEVSFDAHAKRKLAFPPPGEMTRLEPFPPTLFVHSADGVLAPFADKDEAGNTSLGVRCEVMLRAGEEKDLSFVIGYTREKSPAAIGDICSHLRGTGSKRSGLGSAYGEAWLRVLPDFADERDAGLRREMRWNASVLEAMATWREYYDETVVPQGTMYDYIWGEMASSRDLVQHALPLCRTHPALARSVIRYTMKRTLPDGEIKLNDQGFGWAGHGPQLTSDQQLFFFLLLAEYLRATGDATVLAEEIAYYPCERSGRDTGLAHVRQCFLFLRDRIGVGAHGIVRRWNSDWNDMFFFWPTNMPYNRMFEAGESHMNSAMAIVVLGDVAEAIDGAAGSSASELTAAMREYREQLYESWMRDLGERSFPRRVWTDWQTALGEKEMWLEPQGYALLIPEFSQDRKRRLYAELQQRLLTNETMGARQIETPAQQPGTPQGSRENGGFWYALNGPLILGVATFDHGTAEELLRKMTFANFAKAYPDYWTGQWSASDSLDSSLLKTSGLSSAMVYCAHAHAWPLYCYLKLRGNRQGAT